MLDHVIAFSLKNRPLVLAGALALVVAGIYRAARLPVDVFPDLNRPTVTVLTEAPGFAPEEVENLVTRPIEYSLNGATGVELVRSSSAAGLSIVWLEFARGSDIYRDRQMVTEKLQAVRERLPADVAPQLAPVSSIMGEILLLGLRSSSPTADPEQQAMELRTLAEFTVRNRILAVEGVAQVTVIGGILKQFQIVTSPQRLLTAGVALEQLETAAARANALAGGGVMLRSARESLLRLSGRSVTLRDIEETPIVWRDPRAILIRDVADVRFGGPVRRGDASVRVRDASAITGGPAVILAVQKQPEANTLALDRELNRVLDRLETELPAGTHLERNIFRQADFIRTAVDNVGSAVRDGSVWVVVVLFLFLWNFRTSLITLTALPLSILTSVLVFHALGVSVNTMTLGGIAVAVGELVDDAVVDVENVFRRLRENQQKPLPDSSLRVIFLASSEVRNSIVYATLVVCLVVLPLLALGGLEGQLFAPLALAYIVSLGASLCVSLTVTPVLSSYLLPGGHFLHHRHDPLLLRTLKWLDASAVRFALRRPRLVLGGAVLLSCFTLVVVAVMGGEFLPPFNEGTLTINLQAEPGTSLAESNRLGQRVEELLFEVPEVLSVARRTGRAEMDEHAEGVHSSEFDVRLQPQDRPLPGFRYAVMRALPGLSERGFETIGRPRTQVLADLRDRVARLPGVRVNIGQPISHRLEHVLSGVRAEIAVKVFGPDLRILRDAAQDLQGRMQSIAGVVDLQVEPQVEVSQVRIEVLRKEAAEYGLAAGDLVRLLETAYRGRVVSEILDEDRRFDLVVRFDDDSRRDPSALAATVLETPSGRRVALGQVARVLDTTGPNTLNRESLQRRIVVSCNVQGRDLAAVVNDIQRETAPVVAALGERGGDYHVEYGGQFQARREASSRLLWFGLLAALGVFLLLTRALESWRAALQVLVNVPLAAAGSVIALLIVNRPDAAALQAAPWWLWPAIWASATTLSLAHWVGFITLVGIVCRNGILMIAHYLHLLRQEGETFGEEMIVRGSLERLAPVLMTASVAVIGLAPLISGAGQPGKEILHPLAVVVVGGLVASTLLDQLVTPALFFLLGKHTSGRVTGHRTDSRLADSFADGEAAGNTKALARQDAAASTRT